MRAAGRHSFHATRRKLTLASAPDGKLVAFLSDRDGDYDLWLTQVASGHFSNLTRNIPPLASSGFIVVGANTPAYSPDGTRLVYVYKLNRDDPMYLADRTGDDPPDPRTGWR